MLLSLFKNKDYFDFKKVEYRITEMLTKNRLIYSHEYSDFYDLFKKELFGYIDLYKDILMEYIISYFGTYVIGSNLIADKLYNMPTEEKYIRIVNIYNIKKFYVLPLIKKLLTNFLGYAKMHML